MIPSIAERTKRRAHIRRGMKIALYEVNQVLAAHGVKLAFPPGFIDYTVAIAEGGRRDASRIERFEAMVWHTMAKLRDCEWVAVRVPRRR